MAMQCTGSQVKILSGGCFQRDNIRNGTSARGKARQTHPKQRYYGPSCYCQAWHLALQWMEKSFCRERIE